MVDDSYNTYLIEVNTNPCFENGCPVLQKIIPDLLDSSYKIALDPLFTFPELFSSKPGSSAFFSECKYELVFDGQLEGTQLKTLYQNCT